ncbi:golgin-45 isoform X2 [Toxorhynchites rutilus septentrionalis]|uniref:golgin-45 isoform X2 n=1 Tax=Toxorhynchites rutilus septentrionalis TaxID=329112 RepID=UPI00247B15D7|nr:golgin-45 isoform X2 [Toxorhynchites rutilus septentrionalis]
MDTARTQGDGMEYDGLVTGTAAQQQKSSSVPTTVGLIKLPSDIELQRLLPHSGSNPVYRPTELITTTNASLPPTVPKGKIFHLVPKLVQINRAAESLKNKEPKFVPFEPYKGAVNPIMPYKNRENKIKINARNNLDLSVLVSQMSTITSKELKQEICTKSEFDLEKQQYEKQIEELKKERDYYQSQLKFQAQVNSELKNLLVAAVGEDLQTKVNVLTEDKLHLARKLLSSAENLSSHTEQIEYLIGQSEVWRSKFLASSLMVEELARWKTSLLQKNKLLSASAKEMLEVNSKLRDMQIDILRNLKFLYSKKDFSLQSANILDLTAESVNISQQLVLGHSALGMPEPLNLAGLEPMTDAEKLAVQALQNTNEPLMSTDEAFRAIVGQAFPSIRSMKKYVEQNLQDRVDDGEPTREPPAVEITIFTPQQRSWTS